MTIFERVKELSEKQGKSLQRVSEDLGFSSNYFYRMKKQQPTAEKLKLIADYFNVSVDYLLGRDEAKPVNEPIVDIAELANKPKDFDWDKILSAGGKPITEQDKEIIRRLFADKLAD
ncbi:XRE family transcriptional regulator [Lactococcus lactis]|uniref:XRE family transcriptional regulator n=1 Tax=Lactococcus lactis TaxID=1358 RepID=UPI0024A9ED17|nr:XRE family transcriptional regulator [Lactococcus lactis]